MFRINNYCSHTCRICECQFALICCWICEKQPFFLCCTLENNFFIIQPGTKNMILMFSAFLVFINRDGQEIAVVYFREGYDPSSYTSENVCPILMIDSKRIQSH